MTNLQIGDTVKRGNSSENIEQIGTIIEIDLITQRARVKWIDKRTYYKLASLIKVITH